MYLSDISTLQFGDGLMYTELLLHVVIRHLCQRFATFFYTVDPSDIPSSGGGPP